MFIRRLTRHKAGKSYTYLKVVENFWKGGKTRQRTIVNFGNIGRWNPQKVNWLIGQLQQVFGLPRTAAASEVGILRSQHFGTHYAGHLVWESLNLSELLAKLLKRFRVEFDPVPVLKAMVLNRLSDPRSKLAVSRWLPHQCIPDVPEQIPLQHFYRSLHYLARIQIPLEKALFLQLRTLLNLDLSLVFYDLTSSYFQGRKCPLARHGYSRDHRFDRMQIELALLVNGDGLPIAHRVFAGDVKDVGTVPEIIRDLQRQFEIRRCIFVGDSGMVSEAILDQLREAGYEYILALKARVDNKADQILDLLPPAERFEQIKPDTLYAHELPHPVVWADRPRWNQDRFAACRYQETAQRDREDREGRLAESEEFLREFIDPRRKRFRNQPERIHAQIARFLKKQRTTRYFQYEYHRPGEFTYSRIEDEIRRDARHDGLFLLQSNSDRLALPDLVGGYITLAQVESAFREIKDFLHLRPIRHWSEEAVRGHVFICVLAYLLERVLEQTLKGKQEMTARSALEALESVDAVTYDLRGETLRKRTDLNASQKAIFKALGADPVPVVF
ncbi:MAG: IS1634 family transposase [Terriglobia bacterium]